MVVRIRKTRKLYTKGIYLVMMIDHDYNKSLNDILDNQLINKGGIIMARKAYEVKGSTASGPYSAAVDAGDLVYFSGQTAMNSVVSTKHGR